MVKLKIVVVGFLLLLSCGVKGQDHKYCLSCEECYGLSIDFGPSGASYAGEVYCIYSPSTPGDTLFIGERATRFYREEPIVFCVSVYVKPFDSLPIYKLGVFDSLTKDTFLMLPSLGPYEPDSLFEVASNGAILLIPKPINDLVALNQKTYLIISYAKGRLCRLRSPGWMWMNRYTPSRLQSEMNYTRENTDFLFRNPWLLPRDPSGF